MEYSSSGRSLAFILLIVKVAHNQSGSFFATAWTRPTMLGVHFILLFVWFVNAVGANDGFHPFSRFKASSCSELHDAFSLLKFKAQGIGE